jgi:hypothetical protein
MPTFEQVINAIRTAKQEGNLTAQHVHQIKAAVLHDSVQQCPTCLGRGMVLMQEGQDPEPVPDGQGPPSVPVGPDL